MRLELRLRILGWIHVILGGAGLTAATVVCGGLWLSKDPDSATTLAFIGPLALIALVLLAPGLVGGAGLLRGKEWGRVTVAIVSLIYLPGFPLGTALGSFGLWAVLKDDGPGSTGQFPLGSWIRSFRPFKARAAAKARPRESRAAAAARIAERKARRLEELRADPIKRKYVALVEAGESWSDEAIAYAEDREATLTCCHLAPTEHAMRRSGVNVKLAINDMLYANCRIDAAALDRSRLLASPAQYREYYESDRGSDDSPMAYLTCSLHPRAIRVVHPEEATAFTPVFP